MENRILTIMFTDMKGYTSRTSSQSREATLGMITQHKKLLLPIIQGYGGRLVKTIGDAFLVTFESPTDAVLAGMALQKRLRRYNKDLPENQQIEVRIAINTGEVIEDEADIFGEAVNIASRIEGISKPNEIYFTESTYLSMNRTEVPSAEIGYRILKGIPNKIKIYKVLWDRKVPYGVGDSTKTMSAKNFPRLQFAKRLSLFLIAGVLLTGIVFAFLYYRDIPSKQVVEHAPEEPVVPPKKEKAIQAYLVQWNEYRKAVHGLKDKFDEIDRYFRELGYGRKDRQRVFKELSADFNQMRIDSFGVFNKLNLDMKANPAGLERIKAKWDKKFRRQAKSFQEIIWQSRSIKQKKDYWRQVKSEARVAIADLLNSVKQESPPADWETSSQESMKKLDAVRQKIDRLGQRKEQVKEYHVFRKKMLNEMEETLTEWNDFQKGWTKRDIQGRHIGLPPASAFALFIQNQENS